jgi:hypothetical protein
MITTDVLLAVSCVAIYIMLHYIYIHILNIYIYIIQTHKTGNTTHACIDSHAQTTRQSNQG